MSQIRNRDQIQQRIFKEGLRPADAGLMGSATIRLMMGWVLALGLLAITVNLPIYPRAGQIGWFSTPPSDQIMLLPLPPEEKPGLNENASPVTIFTQPEKIDDPLPIEKEIAKEEDSAPLDIVEKPQKLERIDRGPILEFVEESPAIIGGLSTLYLRIDYPKIARDQGIEGLTVLMFIVEKDGSTSQVKVVKPLHPALDSSAVAAVRNTLFKPGRQDGKLVRVKMRLPIRFRLIGPDEQEARQDSLRARSLF